MNHLGRCVHGCPSLLSRASPASRTAAPSRSASYGLHRRLALCGQERGPSSTAFSSGRQRDLGRRAELRNGVPAPACVASGQAGSVPDGGIKGTARLFRGCQAVWETLGGVASWPT